MDVVNQVHVDINTKDNRRPAMNLRIALMRKMLLLSNLPL